MPKRQGSAAGGDVVIALGFYGAVVVRMRNRLWMVDLRLSRLCAYIGSGLAITVPSNCSA